MSDGSRCSGDRLPAAGSRGGAEVTQEEGDERPGSLKG